MAKGGGSTGGGGQSLGRATVEVRADTSQLAGDLAGAKAQVASVGGGMNEVKNAAKGLRSEVKGVLSPLIDIRKTVGLIVSSFGYVGAAVSVVIGLVAAFGGKTDEAKKKTQQLFEEWDKGRKFLEGLPNSLGAIGSPTSQIEKDFEAIEELEDKANKAVAAGYDMITGKSGAFVDAKRKELEATEATNKARFSAAREDAVRRNVARMKEADKKTEAERKAAENKANEEKVAWLIRLNELQAQSQADYIAWIEKRQEAERKANEERIKGLLDAQRETRRLLDMQGQGFGAGDSVGTSASFNQRMLNEMRSLRNSVGGV